MSEPNELWQHLQGRLLALEAILTQTIWRHALTTLHPPSELAAFLRPLEEQAARLAPSPSMPAATVKAAQDTIRDIAQELEHLMHEEILRQTAAPDRDPS